MSTAFILWYFGGLAFIAIVAPAVADWYAERAYRRLVDGIRDWHQKGGRL